jgi:hypothetical protein
LGKLFPYQKQGQTYLQGDADLQVQVDLPPPLNFMPQSMVESAGNSLLKGILNTFKQRLMHQLLADYHVWANTSTEGSPSQSAIDPQAPHLG